MYEGTCVGGPLDGHTITVRCPDGVLVADRPTGRAWLYDRREGEFHVRDQQARQLDPDRAVTTALSEGWDVMALPDAGMADGAGNPDPLRITDAIWRFWLGFKALEPSVLFGGVYAVKPGYHSYRDRLPSTDYSTGRDVAADKRGPGDKASAIDLTMSTAAMMKYTKRLDDAARARDPRLYTPDGPVLREFIGTKDGSVVYCYVLMGGCPLGVGADAGPDPGRDISHLWHLHLSIIRAFCTDADALAGVLSVLSGQPVDGCDRATAEDG